MPALRDETKIRVTGYKGKYSAILDDKNRLTLPAPLRKTPPRAKSRSKKTQDRFVLTRTLDGGLALYPVSEWILIEAKLSEGPFTHPDTRYFSRILYASAIEVVLDSQGRIPVSKPHQEMAGIARDVTVTGHGHFIEIWNPKRYKQYVAGYGKSWEDAARDLNPGL
ncbi:MAG: division/cell wall cluster transcriptional repressor MraZ [candidate division Zixibacteria bacterium]|nr:division/cell wall cluster transcriptional repressor MraZ [candidate division Zixibacteria bacterium]MBU1469431.1 division/cell wall cluster transcriptional repressor MraZ [candidate division Zixibacteria bacterium]MBU2624185.1 division/cell wall cluster transcriptional repressor MraZ [candidate division Zixibacteria bacterium]